MKFMKHEHIKHMKHEHFSCEVVFPVSTSISIGQVIAVLGYFLFF